MVEELLDAVGAPLQGAQARGRGAQQGGTVTRGGPSRDAQLQIPVQVLVRIEIGRIRREIEQRDRIGVRGHPVPDVPRLVDVQIVEDDKKTALQGIVWVG